MKLNSYQTSFGPCCEIAQGVNIVSKIDFEGIRFYFDNSSRSDDTYYFPENKLDLLLSFPGREAIITAAIRFYQENTKYWNLQEFIAWQRMLEKETKK